MLERLADLYGPNSEVAQARCDVSMWLLLKQRFEDLSILQEHHVATQRKTRVLTTWQLPLTFPDAFLVILPAEANEKGLQSLPIANSDFDR